MATRDFRSYFKGGIAKVRIWSRVLAPEEAGNLYVSDTAPKDGLVAEYLLNENTGTVAHDTAGGHDGTIFGATWAT